MLSIIESESDPTITETNFSCAAKAKLSVSEIPAPEPARIGGVRKLQIFRWGAAYYFQFWQELFKWKPRSLPGSARAALESEYKFVGAAESKILEVPGR